MGKRQERPRIGLALGGGGARGAAHVGVLRALEAAGIPIACIAGTSAGAMVGAAYAAGLTTEQIEQVFASVRFRDLFRPAWARDGWLDNAPLAASFERAVGRLRVEDLNLPFAATATDADTGEPVTLDRGPLGPILRASTAMPCIVRPVPLGGRRLVDGGVLHKVPVQLARELGADIVIAVDVSVPYSWRRKKPRHPLVFLMRMLEIMDERLVAAELNGADIIIRPWADCGIFEFHRYRSQILSGQAATEAAIPAIRARLAGFGAPTVPAQVTRPAPATSPADPASPAWAAATPAASPGTPAPAIPAASQSAPAPSVPATSPPVPGRLTLPAPRRPQASSP